MSDEQLSWFKFDWRDYLTGTEGMPWAAQGGYMRILCHLWDKGPLTEKQIRKLLPNIGSRNTTIVIQKLHHADSDLYSNERIARERIKAVALYEKRKVSGHLGGIKKAKILASARVLPPGNPSKTVDTQTQTQTDKETENKNSQKETKKQPSANSFARRRVDLESFQVEASMRKWATQGNFPPPDEWIDEFKDYWRGLPDNRLRTDWPATFRQRLRHMKDNPDKFPREWERQNRTDYDET